MMITGQIRLTILLLTVYSFNSISARTCEGDRGRSIQCDDDESCCTDDNGRAMCCTDAPWWIWLLLAMCIVGGTAFAVCMYCCVMKYISKARERSTETVRVQPVRRYEPSYGNSTTNFTTVETSLNQTETNASTDAPPSYCDVSKSSEHLPPPYPGT